MLLFCLDNKLYKALLAFIDGAVGLKGSFSVQTYLPGDELIQSKSIQTFITHITRHGILFMKIFPS